MDNEEPLDRINHSHPHVVAYLGARAYLFRELPEEHREAPLARLGDLVDYAMLQSKDNMPENERIALRRLHAHCFCAWRASRKPEHSAGSIQLPAPKEQARILSFPPRIYVMERRGDREPEDGQYHPTDSGLTAAGPLYSRKSRPPLALFKESTTKGSHSILESARPVQISPPFFKHRPRAKVRK